MKSCIKILLLLCLCGCQSDTVNKESTPKEEDIGNLQVHQLYHGDGNENGFYHLEMREIGNETIFNIYYYDYATKKEVFLCAKPECKHIDDTCTSYVDTVTALASVLFLHNDHLYLLSDAIASLDTATFSGSQILKMDSNGENRHVLKTLPDGYQFTDNRLIMDDRYVYLPLSQSSYVDTGQSSMQVANKHTLFRLDLQSGEYTEVLDMKNKRLLYGDGKNLIFASYRYEQDPETLLQEQNYEEYDRVMMNASLLYTSYDLSTNTYGEEIASVTNTIGIYDQHAMYELLNNELYAISFEDYQTTSVASLPKDGKQYILQENFDGHIIIDAHDAMLDGIASTYVYTIADRSISPLTLFTAAPKQHVEIIAETKDSYFIIYDQKQQLTTTWAGVEQYQIEKNFYGLIDKEDYWNSQPNYLPIETIHQP